MAVSGKKIAQTRKTAQKRTESSAPETAILDAAEALFAEIGFDGASVRTIGQRAKVNPALIHYYFSSKDELLTKVIERRALEINGRRRERLLVLFAEAAPSLPSLEEVLDAILRPTIEFGRGDALGGRNYAVLINSLSASIDSRIIKLINENFDPIARFSIESIMRVVSDINRYDVVNCYLAAIRLAFALMAPTGRAKELSDGEDREEDVEQAIDFAIRFSAAGIRGIASSESANPAT